MVAIARKDEAPIAEDCGVSESCVRNWLTRADIEDGRRPGVTTSDSAELRELRRRNRLLGQEDEQGVGVAAALHGQRFPGLPGVAALDQPEQDRLAFAQVWVAAGQGSGSVLVAAHHHPHHDAHPDRRPAGPRRTATQASILRDFRFRRTYG